MSSVDGKHVRIQCPFLNGSEYFDYKKYFSSVLMLILGSLPDRNIFVNLRLGIALEIRSFNFPAPKKLQSTNMKTLPFLVEDEAFLL